jgi:hypothetical protein
MKLEMPAAKAAFLQWIVGVLFRSLKGPAPSGFDIRFRLALSAAISLTQLPQSAGGFRRCLSRLR